MTAANALPKHWTVDDLLTMPRTDDFRREIFDGVLVVNSLVSVEHQDITFNLRLLLRTAIREHGLPVRVADAVDVILADDRLLIPDVLVANADAKIGHTGGFGGGDVLIAIEVVSKWSRGRDLSLKPYMYAEADIPRYWRIEPHNYRGRTKELPAVIEHELTADATYQVIQTAGAGERFSTSWPVPVEFGPAELTVPRRNERATRPPERATRLTERATRLTERATRVTGPGWRPP